MSDDLRRVLKDPAHRLPDSLVDLDAVHAAARRHQRRRTGLAAVGGAVVVLATSLAVVHPWSPTDQRPPVASPGPTPTVAPSDSPPSSPSPDPSPSAVSAGGAVLGVSALSDSSWWVLRQPFACPSAGADCPYSPVELLKTQDGGSTFASVSSSTTPDGIPGRTSTIRFLNPTDGYALVSADVTQLWTTSDGGRTWTAAKPISGIVALEAGGGIAWLLILDGGKVGVTPLGPVGLGSFVAAGPIWLGSSNGVAPALTVQGGDAVVFWYNDPASHLSIVSKQGTVQERVNPCTRDLGTGSVSASGTGLAVSCHTGSLDAPKASSDGGRSWADLPYVQGGRFVVGSINGGFTAVGGQDGTLTLASSDVNQPIRTSGAQTSKPWTWIGFTSQTSGFAIDGAGRLFHTDQRGTSWTEVSYGTHRPASTSSLRTCQPDDLRVVHAGSDGAGGREYVYVDARNDGSDGCTMGGQPQITAAGTAVTVEDGRCCGVPAQPVVLRPGEMAHLTIEANNQVCRDDASAVAHEYRHLALVWGGETLPLDGDENLDQPDAALTSCTGTLNTSLWQL